VSGCGQSLAPPLFRLSVRPEQDAVSVAAARGSASIINKCTDGVCGDYGRKWWVWLTNAVIVQRCGFKVWSLRIWQLFGNLLVAVAVEARPILSKLLELSDCGFGYV